MKLEEIKKVVKYINGIDYKTLFAALITYENMDFLDELEDMTDGDVEYLEDLYTYYMKTDMILVNAQELTELYNEYKEIEGEE